MNTSNFIGGFNKQHIPVTRVRIAPLDKFTKQYPDMFSIETRNIQTYYACGLTSLMSQEIYFSKSPANRKICRRCAHHWLSGWIPPVEIDIECDEWKPPQSWRELPKENFNYGYPFHQQNYLKKIKGPKLYTEWKQGQVEKRKRNKYNRRNRIKK